MKKKLKILKYGLIIPVLILLMNLNTHKYFISNDYLKDTKADYIINTSVFLEDDYGSSDDGGFDITGDTVDVSGNSGGDDDYDYDDDDDNGDDDDTDWGDDDDDDGCCDGDDNTGSGNETSSEGLQLLADAQKGSINVNKYAGFGIISTVKVHRKTAIAIVLSSIGVQLQSLPSVTIQQVLTANDLTLTVAEVRSTASQVSSLEIPPPDDYLILENSLEELLSDQIEEIEENFNLGAEIILIKRYYLDMDGDDYHSVTVVAENHPGASWNTSSSGIDCDDSNEYLSTACDSNSPFRINLDALITDNESAKEKFLCIYNTLTQSPKFKALFLDTFGQEDRDMDIDFQIVDLGSASGKTVANLLDVRQQSIQLDEDLLMLNHPLIVAQTIIHEALHAFINVKQVECIDSPNSTTTYDYINSLNQLTFDELINDFYLDCDTNQPEQHRLMYNRMVDVLDEMLEDVFYDLVASADQGVQNFTVPTIQGAAHVFNWDDAIHYLNLAGLQEAKEYKEDILADPTIVDLVQNYIISLNDSGFFIQNTCDE